MQKRKSPYSKLYKFQQFEGSSGMLIPIVNDLDDEVLIWHYERAMDEEDYEYAHACFIEITTRDIWQKQ